METINDLTYKVIGAAYKVHRVLGPGLLENAYKECLYYLLARDGIFVEKEKSLPLIFEEVKLEAGYRIDLFVENKVVVEIKAVESFTDVHMAQVLTYMKLSGSAIGLLLNFNVADMKKGIKRMII
ncbi:MAG: GxxExxY protein [Chitinophagaceae bacterium]|nr:GxxExxY protein [Chitinophagaceae bacterium]MBK7123096.1 GxxExxY protein [Chitinophagaceae bacterium]MBK9533302.1 GxxExxY protein [Chitinophagaceae bacterium]HQW91686.1 GxxExxY protein [Ferruginibacter sp.]